MKIIASPAWTPCSVTQLGGFSSFDSVAGSRGRGRGNVPHGRRIDAGGQIMSTKRYSRSGLSEPGPSARESEVVTRTSAVNRRTFDSASRAVHTGHARTSSVAARLRALRVFSKPPSGLSISLPGAHVCQFEITPSCQQRAKVGPREAARGCPPTSWAVKWLAHYSYYCR
jgi:hypothetical protein